MSDYRKREANRRRQANRAPVKSPPRSKRETRNRVVATILIGGLLLGTIASALSLLANAPAF